MGSENMLAAYKKIKSGEKITKQMPAQASGGDEYITGSVEFLDEQAFGKYVPQENDADEKTWSPESELASLDSELTSKQFEASNLPDYIKESIRKNPLIDTSAAKAALQEVDDKLVSRMGGFEASKKILETLDANDRKGRSRTAMPAMDETQYTEHVQPASTVDYSVIKQIVEDVVTKKVSALRKSLLTEGVASGGGPTVSLLRLGDTFTFLDSDDNVYECKMIYKGKRKRK